MEDKRAAEETNSNKPMDVDSNQDSTNSQFNLSALSKSPVRSIESPKYSLRLSPIQKFLRVHSPPS